ncbi:hypothetical protein Geob_0988 [Geotalea daltonii FRC-32]|uniref:Uncharacterized protein n=1 Tax=Geotalea daltonii (strain DSM 22248 / JCM 15807 / FRC-32) TaxID=316067 RepID=B9M2H1_GEODF|nr:hypothetical protein [Geotalea daltonii]ACM19350.1 hypothetical protein Geob_0988 [Geotalea daltonii FRC-32]
MYNLRLDQSPLRSAGQACDVVQKKKMNESETYSWIFLSVPEKPASLQEVIATADGLNHAIPTHKELQTSLGWLIQQGLVCKVGKKYSLTEEGIELRKNLTKKSKTLMKSWNMVAKKFETMVGASAIEEDVTENDVARAYSAYKKCFWQTYEKLKKT